MKNDAGNLTYRDESWTGVRYRDMVLCMPLVLFVTSITSLCWYVQLSLFCQCYCS